MKLIRLLKAIFCKKAENYPMWVHGLECSICQMTFIGPKEHQDHARRHRLIREHKGKIPKL